MSSLLDRVESVLEGDLWEERPVLIEEFVESKKYLGLSFPLGDLQYEAVSAMTQILRYETLVDLYGPKEAERRYKETNFEIILMLGKGAGKDYCSTVACAYIVYILLCMKDPAAYYGKDTGDAIDIINIAINANQAKNVFFKGFLNKIVKSQWFIGRYKEKTDQIDFDKGVTVYSGHSEREGYEGYNTLAVFLDEISGFALESASGNENAKTAGAIYKMYKASVRSRFSEFGKLISLSFPRFADDFISSLYKEAVVDKIEVPKSETVRINPDLPWGHPANEVTIEWLEDEILRYNRGRVYALRRPTWIFHPKKELQEYAEDFATDPADAYGRVAAMPSTVEGGFFKNQSAIDACFSIPNGVDEYGGWRVDFRPKDGVKYYGHVDLSEVHDLCAVAVAHVEKWVTKSIENIGYSEPWPVVVIDSVRWWKPSKAEPMDFAEVREYLLNYRRKGFDLALTTFDRWHSRDTMRILSEQGMKVDNLSLNKKHYDDFLSMMYDGRLYGPDDEDIRQELKNLMLIKGKVDHPRKGTNDRAEAMCGAIYNAAAYTDRPTSLEVEVHSLRDIRRQERTEKKYPPGVIVAPPNTQIPDEISQFLGMPKLL